MSDERKVATSMEVYKALADLLGLPEAKGSSIQSVSVHVTHDRAIVELRVWPKMFPSNPIEQKFSIVPLVEPNR